MRKRPTLLLAALLAGAPLPPAHAASDDTLDDFRTPLTSQWQLVRHDRLRSIKTYARQEDQKRFRSFKVEALLATTLPTVARVLLDFDSYGKWYWEVRESRLLRRDSPTEYYLYMVHRAPYGLPDRDVILHASIEPPAPGRKAITLRIRASPDLLPLKPPLVRMSAEDMSVRFTPLPDDKVLLEAEGYVDPGGKVPVWANNFIQRSAPYSILLGLQRMTQLDVYRQNGAPLPFPLDSTGESDYKLNNAK